MPVLKKITDLLPGFETAADVKERRQKLITQLAAGSKASRKIGTRLKRCRTAKPCGLPICPRCLRHLRKSFVLGAMKYIYQAQKTTGMPASKVTAFSGILATDQYPLGQLPSADLNKLKERLQRRHQRARFPLVFAGVDISLNENVPTKPQAFWQFQVYGVVVGMKRANVRAALEGLYQANHTIVRPLMVRDCTDFAAALSYTIKPYFSRRVSYRGKHGRMDTRPVCLRASEFQELAIWIAQYPITVRYVLTGCRRYNDRIESNAATKKKLISKRR